MGNRNLEKKIRDSEAFYEKDCVAIFLDENSKLYAAANSHQLREDDINSIVKDFNKEEELFKLFFGFSGKPMNIPEFKIVVEGTMYHMHAEMQLLRYLRNRNITPKCSFMGVSKPCCQRCAEELNKYRIKYSTFHNDLVQNWEPPF